jgi:regulator of protease activity HflC (stomatin/prohibitin superfamily)
MNRIALRASLIAFVSIMAACTVEMHNVPAGYVGRILTPTGWDTAIQESGQVDLKSKDTNGRYAVLVLLESTTTTVKEQFLAAGQDPKRKTDGTDHRILTKNGTPLSVDFYVRCLLHDDAKVRNNIFAQITPLDTKDDREKMITIEMVYDHFASMDVRSGARRIFGKYATYEEVLKNMEAINTELEAMVIETFKRNNVPLKIQNAQISNVKPDEKVYATRNELSSADSKVQSIDQIGAALRRNPEYVAYMKWETLREVAGKGTTIIVNESDRPMAVTVPARQPAEK